MFFVVIISFLILILKILYRRNQLVFELFTVIIPISFLMSLNKILEVFFSGNRSDSYFARQGEISFYLNEVSEKWYNGNWISQYTLKSVDVTW